VKHGLVMGMRAQPIASFKKRITCLGGARRIPTREEDGLLSVSVVGWTLMLDVRSVGDG
jgi:hypothetical protein